MALKLGARPGLPFSGRRDHESTENLQAFQHDINYLDLRRAVMRYQHLILLTPSPSHDDTALSPLQKQIQAELWSPLPYHRSKWLCNVEGARSLLLQLERKAQSLRVQRVKQEALKDLAEKRSIIKRLRHRIEEIGREVELMGHEWQPSFGDDGDTVYDALLELERERQQSPSHDRNAQGDAAETDHALAGARPVASVEESPDHSEPPAGTVEAQDLFSSSSVRRRGHDRREASTQPEAKTSGFATAPSTERSLLDSSRVQEDLTTSLVNMAVQLKQQGQSIAFSLDQDKTILGRAMHGLDVNLSGMEAASKNMAFLRRMSEEEGWIGRLKLYAMIFAMWVVAILLVFVCPKLRF